MTEISEENLSSQEEARFTDVIVGRNPVTEALRWDVK